MSRPELISRIGFGSDPDVTAPAYYDTSAHLLTLNTRRGRNEERGQVDAGNATPTFDNGERTFDPTYTLSPYWPNVIPMVKTQHAAEWLDIEYPLHTGFVQKWPIKWEGPTWGTVSPPAVDAFAALAQAGITGTFPEETTGERIARVLSAAGWPESTPAAGYWVLGTSQLGVDNVLSYGIPETVIDTGEATVAAVTIPAEQPVMALTHIQAIADAEPGVFFIDGLGRAVFQDRTHRYGTVSVLTFSDDPGVGEVYYEDIGEPAMDVAKVVNEVVASADIDGTQTVVAIDEESRQQFLRRTLTMTPPLTTVAALEGRANFELALHAQPAVRFDQVIVRPEGQPDAWPDLLTLELGDKVTLERTPGSAPFPSETITRTCFVESIAHTITEAEWAVELQLSPAAFYESFWVLGTSALDISTVLAY